VRDITDSRIRARLQPGRRAAEIPWASVIWSGRWKARRQKPRLSRVSGHGSRPCP